MNMKQESRIVWIAAIIQLINIVDFMMVMPLGPDISKDLPVTNSDIGIICGCYTLAVGISGIACAKFLDRFDRKHVALVAVLGLSLATLGATFSWDLTTLTGARVLAGLFGGPAAAIAFSIVCDVVPPERRGKAMAIVMGTFSVSAVAAIPFGLELAEKGTWRTPFYAISILGFIVFWLILRLTPSLKEHLKGEPRTLELTRLFSNGKFLLAFIMMATAMISSYAIIPNISAYFQLNLGYPRSSLGFLYLVGGLFSLILIQIGGRASDKIGPIPTNILGTILLVVFLYDGFMHQPTSSLLVVFSMFMGMVCFRNVSATTEASKIPQPHERAAFMSLFSSIQHLGNGIGAFLASAILSTGPEGDLINMKWVGLLSIVMALIQPLILIMIRHSNTVQKDPVTA
ncbi:MAG: MFS transporter [Pseudodesulfovibrio sp.]|nr:MULTISPECIES: MFS transporter [Pseudodesulfovibrio]MBU4521944.1 MFS transporter [Pseudomonadota bacterium]MBU4558372.1 MFS transporter [Pseudomonadota bacterium]MBV1765574.1 MFS transporter [Pseudodesulfovibrio sp.]MBV1773544.1 MFS transporter [Pseudodesulfovibrio sp.]